VIRDRDTGLSRGYGFVTYVHPTYAAAAMTHLNGAVLLGPFQGRAIRVSPSHKGT
jgi:RNA recognition motif-containing protein